MIAIGIPWNNEHIPTRFMMDLIASDLMQDSLIIMGNVDRTDANRNQCVRLAMKHGAETIYFLDVDQQVPRDVRARLSSHGKDIVSGLAMTRNGQKHLAYRKDGKGGFTSVAPKVPEVVDGVGFGCVRINMEVFRKIPPPWFRDSHDEYGEFLIGHDLNFCQKAQDAGYEIWVDPEVFPAHYATVAVGGKNVHA